MVSWSVKAGPGQVSYRTNTISIPYKIHRHCGAFIISVVVGAGFTLDLSLVLLPFHFWYGLLLLAVEWCGMCEF